MSSTPELDRTTDQRPQRAPRTRFVAWPLWATLAGVAGIVGTLVTDLRPEAEIEAGQRGEDYIVGPADMLALDPMIGRIGFTAGMVAVAALIVFSALWRRNVETVFTRSAGARIVSGGIFASAGALIFGYGWRGALANYLGPESGLYDGEGLFVYYVLTDFGAYIAWGGVVVSALGLAWMAWGERNVSRVLGTVAAVFGAGAAAAVVVSGVPGLPGVFMPAWLTITGVWLAVGRSRITRDESAR